MGPEAKSHSPLLNHDTTLNNEEDFLGTSTVVLGIW